MENVNTTNNVELLDEIQEISVEEVESRFEYNDAVMCCIVIVRF